MYFKKLYKSCNSWDIVKNVWQFIFLKHVHYRNRNFHIGHIHTHIHTHTLTCAHIKTNYVTALKIIICDCEPQTDGTSGGCYCNCSGPLVIKFTDVCMPSQSAWRFQYACCTSVHKPFRPSWEYTLRKFR